MASTHHFADLLFNAIRAKGSPVCVGLDPVLESLPDDVKAAHHEPIAAIAEFTKGVLHAVAGIVPAVKFQSACFERHGSRGVAVLEETMLEAAKLGLVVIWDAKRGDIGVTASHYAAAARRLHAAAITVNGYLGQSGITPFIDAGLGVFVLVRTSNTDSDGVQSVRLSDGRTVAEMLADQTALLGRATIGSCGLSAVGAVVGATKSGEAAALRARMPDQFFLIPGYGAQGGTAKDVRDMRRNDGTGVLVTASRSIIYAPGGAGWRENVKAAARKLSDEVRAVVSG